MYFDKLMCMVTVTHMEIKTDTMHQYVVGPTALKMMMRMLSDELDEGAMSVYPDARKARVRFQQDAIIERMNTIANDQSLSSVCHHRSWQGCRRVGLTRIF